MIPEQTVPAVSPDRTVDVGMVTGRLTPATTATVPARRSSAKSDIRTPAKEPLPPHALAEAQIRPRPGMSALQTRCQDRKESMNSNSDPPARILSAVESFVMSNEGRCAIPTPLGTLGGLEGRPPRPILG